MYQKLLNAIPAVLRYYRCDRYAGTTLVSQKMTLGDLYHLVLKYQVIIIFFCLISKHIGPISTKNVIMKLKNIYLLLVIFTMFYTWLSFHCVLLYIP